MKIGLQTWGTEGDIRPFIALATGLQTTGHDVTLAVTEIQNNNFSQYSERFNIAIRHVGHIDCDDEKFKQLAYQIFNDHHPARKGQILMTNFFDPVANDMLDV